MSLRKPRSTLPKTEVLPADVVDFYQQLFLRMLPIAVARRLWEVVLTPKQRQLLGTSFEDAAVRYKSAVGMWLRLHPRITGEQAVVDVAWSIDQLSAVDRAWLLRELLGVVPDKNLDDRPRWSRDEGKLFWRVQLIRRVQVRKNSNIVKVLDAFEEDGWPPRVDSPLRSAFDGQRLRDAVRVLNQNLERIRFFSDGDRSGIRWERR